MIVPLSLCFRESQRKSSSSEGGCDVHGDDERSDRETEIDSVSDENRRSMFHDISSKTFLDEMLCGVRVDGGEYVIQEYVLGG